MCAEPYDSASADSQAVEAARLAAAVAVAQGAGQAAFDAATSPRRPAAGAPPEQRAELTMPLTAESRTGSRT
jgi:hypothetical protein